MSDNSTDNSRRTPDDPTDNSRRTPDDPKGHSRRTPDDPTGHSRHWMILALLTIFAVYFYVFMEWLFFFTKPSFLSTLSFLGSLQVLFAAPLPLIAVAALGLFLCRLPAGFVRNRILQTALRGLGQMIPSLIFAGALLLLIDNFTYTIFRFGIINTQGIARYVYAYLFIILSLFSYQLASDTRKVLIKSTLYRTLARVVPGVIVVSLAFAAVHYFSSGLAAIKTLQEIGPLKNRPNILILASDGLNAENMSVYGYRRDTTPFMRELAEDALICENCFTNAGTSGGSIASMFTGKLPTETRVVYPPDILKGKDAYQHLPGILRQLGYRSIDISVRHYADPYDLNMQNSFDMANGRRIKGNYTSDRVSLVLGLESGYLLRTMRDRMTSRLGHAFGMRKMEDAYSKITGAGKKRTATTSKYETAKNIQGLFALIEASSAPFFAHLHLLDTHGPKFYPRKRSFSRGKEQRESWMTDFYDDAVLSFDLQVKEIIQKLKRKRLYHNTIIVICTDHGQRFKINMRIPLIFLFPGGAHAGNIKPNVQNLDIAATILDYLGVEQPEWMGGQSLLSSGIEPTRCIFTVDRKHGDIEKRTARGLELDKSKIGPPFYSLGTLGVICCHKIFLLNVERSTLSISDIKGHTSPCSEDEIPGPDRIERLLIEHLNENNYDTSSIKLPLARRLSN